MMVNMQGKRGITLNIRFSIWIPFPTLLFWCVRPYCALKALILHEILIMLLKCCSIPPSKYSLIYNTTHSFLSWVPWMIQHIDCTGLPGEHKFKSSNYIFIASKVLRWTTLGLKILIMVMAQMNISSSMHVKLIFYYTFLIHAELWKFLLSLNAAKTSFALMTVDTGWMFF